jgi:nitrite reductase/ring-hydroxylating ferredoxin subunit
MIREMVTNFGISRVSDISQGKSKTFTITYDNDTKKIEIALFNVEGKFYAISNRCAHEGGPLGKGSIGRAYSDMSLAWMEIFCH